MVASKFDTTCEVNRMGVNILNAFGAAKKVETAIEAGAEHLKADAAPVVAFVAKAGKAIPTLYAVLESQFAAAVSAGKITQAQSDEFFALEKEAETLAPLVLKLEQDAAAALKTVQEIVK